MSVIKRGACLALAAVLLLCINGCGIAPKKERMAKNYLEFFDTVSQLIGYESDAGVFEKNCEAVYSLLEDYHRLTDIYHSYEGVNNVRTINQKAGVEPVAVDERLIDLLLFSKEMYAQTNGRCNIAMGSVLSIWHRCREIGIGAPENAALPDMEELNEAAQHCDIDDIVIDEDAGTVFLRDAEMSLDLGAVAKGYTVERAAELLVSRGVTEGYTLNIGGNVRTLGKKGDGGDWKAGIQNPDTESDSPYVVRVTLEGAALVTSGNYQRYYEVDGVRYHHIIDPDTLMPARFCDSVSVLAADSGIADALSTALFNLSVEDGKALLSEIGGADALWVLSDGTTECTDGFRDYISD